MVVGTLLSDGMLLMASEQSSGVASCMFDVLRTDWEISGLLGCPGTDVDLGDGVGMEASCLESGLKLELEVFVPTCGKNKNQR